MVESLDTEADYFRIMADGIPFMIWVQGAQGGQEFANRAYCEYFGVTREQMLGQRWQELLHPEDRDGYVAEFMACVRDRRPFHAEARVRRADGEWRWVESFGSPRFSETGEFLGFVGTSPDVTERKEVEQALRKSGARYKMLHESQRDAFVLVGMEGRLLDFNDHYCRMLGYSADELHALTYQELTPERWHAFENRILREQILLRGYSDVYEKEYRCRDGAVISVELRTILVRDEHGLPSAMWATVRDISERKRTEEALRQSEERLRLALDAAFTMSFEWDIQLNETRRSSKEPALSATQPEKPGTFEQVLEVVHPDDREQFKAKTDAALKSGEYENEFRVVRPNGEIVWLHERGRVQRDAQGQPIRLVGLSQDITLRKIAEEGLRQAKENLERMVSERTSELVAANRSLKQQAHQLRVLARELTLSEQRERKRLAKILHDGLQQYLVAAKFQLEEFTEDVPSARFKAAVPGICNLLSEALKISRSLSAELSPSALHEAGILAGLEWLSRWMFEKHRLKVHLAIETDNLSLGEDVKVLLFESIREMLLNVVKHAGTYIAKVHLAQVNDNELQITVSDDGYGFNLGRLSCTADTDGGFGLFSIRERIALSGGRFEAQSSPGKGARFTLTVPITNEPVGSEEGQRINDLQQPENEGTN